MNDEPYRIGKFLAHAGLCSRREAAEFLNENEVYFKEKRITELNFKISPDETILVNGKPYSLQKTVIVLLNKPPGYVCSHREQRNQRSIFRLLPADMSRYFFAGRLDEDSRGLVILSNNGDYIYELTHPKNEKTKIYHVHSSRPLSEDEIGKIKRGIWNKGEKLSIDKIIELEETAFYEIHLHEGKNREIRRIFEGLGLYLIDLYRIQVDKFKVEDIPTGEYKII